MFLSSSFFSFVLHYSVYMNVGHQGGKAGADCGAIVADSADACCGMCHLSSCCAAYTWYANETKMKENSEGKEH